MSKVKVLVPMLRIGSTMTSRLHKGNTTPVARWHPNPSIYLIFHKHHSQQEYEETHSYLHMPDCSIIHDVVVDDTFRLKNVTVTVCFRGVSHIFLLES